MANNRIAVDAYSYLIQLEKCLAYRSHVLTAWVTQMRLKYESDCCREELHQLIELTTVLAHIDSAISHINVLEDTAKGILLSDQPIWNFQIPENRAIYVPCEPPVT